MLFGPKCPICGGKCVSAESDDFEFGSRHANHWLRTQAITGHQHPYLRAFTLAVGAGREVYKRVAGEKRCESCGHTFR